MWRKEVFLDFFRRFNVRPELRAYQGVASAEKLSLISRARLMLGAERRWIPSWNCVLTGWNRMRYENLFGKRFVHGCGLHELWKMACPGCWSRWRRRFSVIGAQMGFLVENGAGRVVPTHPQQGVQTGHAAAPADVNNWWINPLKESPEGEGHVRHPETGMRFWRILWARNPAA